MLAGGARALLSLTGTQLDAMNYWDFKRPNPRRYRQEDVTGNKLLLFLMGGRGLYDMSYGWDMAKLGETYLEYTYDLGENDTDYFEADQHNVALYGYRWMGTGISGFTGYLRSRQLAQWETSATSALKTLPVPVGNPVRRICVQAKDRGIGVGGTFSELEVRCNEGEYSPVIVKSMMEWCMSEAQEYTLHNEIGGIEYLIANTRMDLPYWWSYYEGATAWEYGLASATPRLLEYITPPARLCGNATTAGEATFSTRGYGFQKCLRIGFDHEYEGFDLLQTRGLGAVDLLVTEAHADYAAAMFVQDVVPY